MVHPNIPAATITIAESDRRRDRMRSAAGAALLALQLAFVVRARFSESRYLCWAPFHSEARYTVDASVGGIALGDGEVARRYALTRLYWDPATRTDWELNAMAHVIDTVRATEVALPAHRRATVVVTYRVNGRPPERWRYP